VTDEDRASADTWGKDGETNPLLKLSVARCASLSYKTVDGLPMTYEPG
jgi:hypothetical protein